jgi:ubiquinone/menaquinone biosynthesis C-methylase UbiE
MISPALRALVRCPACRAPLAEAATGATASSLLRCTQCGVEYPQSSEAWLDLRPPVAYAERTRYLDEALHADARHESVSPPLLQAGVRQRQLRAFLAPGPGDRVIDLGCGSGRSMLWNAASGATFVGADVSPFFAAEARARADLTLADLRQLPFGDGAFTRGYALDVLEHLSPAALDAMLAEAARVIAPGGALFVYSHVRKNAPIAKGLRAINALARGLERIGLIDMTQERLRKSDHLNPLTDIPHLEAVVARAGFRIARIRYYTPLVGGFVENILMRMAERLLARLAARRQGAEPATSGGEAQAAAVREARTGAKARIARGGLVLKGLEALTWLMEIDMILFGHIRSGPFFALLERLPNAPPHPRE